MIENNVPARAPLPAVLAMLHARSLQAPSQVPLELIVLADEALPLPLKAPAQE